MSNSNFNANKVVISLSGGLDSTCLLLKLLAEGKEVRAYSFRYGQKHQVELHKVQKNISFLQKKGLPVTHQIINLEDVFSDSASSLHQGGEAIPHGMYDQDNMKSTVVENRNIIFSSIIYGKALSWANKTNENVYITQGIHAGDHCLTEDTTVLTKHGPVPIKDIKVGDVVYSFNSSNEIVEDVVTQVIDRGWNDTIYSISTPYGSMELTSQHKVYIHNSLNEYVLKEVQDLKRGDVLRMAQFERDKIYDDLVPIISVARSVRASDAYKVYDIEVEKNHNFFAGTGQVLISNSIYPDCRPESQEMARELYRISNWGSERVDFIAPFVCIDKGEVLSAGIGAMKHMGFSDEQIDEVLRNTHTCYDPNEKGESCGLCGSCTERIEAFVKNGRRDPVDYSLDPQELDKIYEDAKKRLEL